MWHVLWTESHWIGLTYEKLGIRPLLRQNDSIPKELRTDSYGIATRWLRAVPKLLLHCGCNLKQRNWGRQDPCQYELFSRYEALYQNSWKALDSTLVKPPLRSRPCRHRPLKQNISAPPSDQILATESLDTPYITPRTLIFQRHVASSSSLLGTLR
jgi:hypothetical protein